MAMAEIHPPAGRSLKATNPRVYSFAGYVIIFITFGIFGIWAYFAVIASAVVAPGVVSLENNRKIVQHLEGGIVQKIFVQEAAFVQIGDPIIVLENVEFNSSVAVLEQRKAVLEAVISRLIAEQTYSESLKFPDNLTESDDPLISGALQTQINIFNDRRSIFMSQTEIFEFRAHQLTAQAEGYQMQLDALERRLVLRTELLERMRTGEERGVVENNRLSEMQDSVIQIEASIGEVISEIAQVKAAAGEAQLSIIKLKQEYSERANTELKQARAELNEVDEQLNVSRDRLRRTTILAPTTGRVQNLMVTTPGSVIRPGEVLMEIIPSDETLLVDARVAPVDVSNVRPGLETEVRFTSFKNKLSDIVLGQVQSVSADVMTSGDSSHPPYYLARIKVDEASMTAEVREGLTAGMPADVVILTGERSVLQYITSPLMDAFSKSLREE